MTFTVLTLFPRLFAGFLGESILARAIERGLVAVRLVDVRDYAADRHRVCDDAPYGGGPGMVMKVEPLRAAILDAKRAAPGSRVAYLSPQGRRFDQQAAAQLAARDGVILVAGRYEGIDERIIARFVDEEWSIGDYVLSGGELAAMVLMDAVIRLLPGVLGHEDSAAQDSYTAGLLDCPHYTRPEEIDGLRVPAVLLSGNHEAIRRWRLKQALGRTWERRPDLLAHRELTGEERKLLDEYLGAREGADATGA